MSKLHELFLDLRGNKYRYLAFEDKINAHLQGKKFEDKIDAKLRELEYGPVTASDIGESSFEAIKSAVLHKTNESYIANFTDLRRLFIHQPFGSQNYPDFLVLDDNRIVSIEAKCIAGGQGSPVWNSGLPRPNGIYIFGSRKRNDLTFFLGGDILSPAEAQELHGFFDELKEHQTCFNQAKMKEQSYGFAVYIRKAFEQKKAFNKMAILDFFANPNRRELENAVITCLRG